MGFLKALVSALALLATAVSGSSLIFNNCDRDVFVNQYSYMNGGYVNPDGVEAVPCLSFSTVRLVVSPGAVSNFPGMPGDVFSIHGVSGDAIFDQDGDVYDDSKVRGYDRYTCGGKYTSVYSVDGKSDFYLCKVSDTRAAFEVTTTEPIFPTAPPPSSGNSRRLLNKP